jgi:arsenate reductase
MATGEPKPLVLFVCTHNSARSQIAEALLRARYGDRVEARSAGTEPRGVHPGAVRAMAEVGIDLRGSRSKRVEAALADGDADVVVTVCDHARETCPWVPARRMALHRSFEDPSARPEDEQEEAFRRVRDEIAERIDRVAPGWVEAGS